MEVTYGDREVMVEELREQQRGAWPTVEMRGECPYVCPERMLREGCATCMIPKEERAELHSVKYESSDYVSWRVVTIVLEASADNANGDG